jgi:hypothetical protein
VPTPLLQTPATTAHPRLDRRRVPFYVSFCLRARAHRGEARRLFAPALSGLVPPANGDAHAPDTPRCSPASSRALSALAAHA